MSEWVRYAVGKLPGGGAELQVIRHELPGDDAPPWDIQPERGCVFFLKRFPELSHALQSARGGYESRRADLEAAGVRSPWLRRAAGEPWYWLGPWVRPVEVSL